MAEYFGEHWHQILLANNLNSFEQIWNLKAAWFEAPNIRRGGWSGVVKHALHDDRKTIDIFIKRQENHVSKTIFHPIKGIATFKKEFHNIQRLTEKQIPTLELVYFGSRHQQATLITKSLEGYSALDSAQFNTLTSKQKQALLSNLATATVRMHHNHFQHNCFYPKHIFVKQIKGQWEVKFIDLEKLKRTPLKKQAVVRDLLTLYRHAGDCWTKKDRLYFFKSYVGEEKLTQQSKNLWHEIAKKIQAKRKTS